VAPSDRSYYNTAVFMSQGYLVLQPDIVFRTRQPGWSVVECIGAAVERVIEMGVVDPERIGIVGHSCCVARPLTRAVARRLTRSV
jgi:dipeptidyl aminopeptidase/acylaminoacyl peptidase